MKNACLYILILLGFSVFSIASHGELTIVGPTVSAHKAALEGHEFYIIETYSWDSKKSDYKLESVQPAGYNLRARTHCAAEGKGYFSISAIGDLYKYSSAHHPEDEKPTHLSGLEGESKTRIKVGSGWPIIIFSGLKSADVTAMGKLITDSTGKYELKGQGKVDTSSGGGSGSAGPVGGGTKAISTIGVWIKDLHTFRVSVLEVVPPRPQSAEDDDDGSGDDGEDSSMTQQNIDNSPDCNYCTTGGCSACPTLGACGHTYSPSEANSHSATICMETDTYGNSCTATGIYVCQTHTHQYPTGKCNRGPCTIPVSYATQHKLTCINGHTYWSCVSSQHELHRTQNPCTRYKWKDQVWNPTHSRYERAWGECGESWAKCDTRCRDGNGAVGQHH